MKNLVTVIPACPGIFAVDVVKDLRANNVTGLGGRAHVRGVLDTLVKLRKFVVVVVVGVVDVVVVVVVVDVVVVDVNAFCQRQCAQDQRRGIPPTLP
jgi:hypothetical protein